MSLEELAKDYRAAAAPIRLRLRQLRQEAAVGGQAQLLQLRDGPQPPADIQNSPPHQRFPAGESDLLDAQSDRRSPDLHKLLYREDRAVRSLFHALRWHTVPTAVVA